MPKNRHHFVPQLYLKAFSSAPRRIHVFNLKKGEAIFDVSLRDQCYGHKLYGRTDEVEDMLSRLETQTAPVLNELLECRRLPTRGTKSFELLVGFVSGQLSRTPASGALLNSALSKMVKQAHSRDPRHPDIESMEIGYDNPTLASLGFAPVLQQIVTDLELELVCSENQQFVTSDSPACKYNQYCEGIEYFGVTGGASRGLQIFFPLGPHLLLVMYDREVYKVKRQMALPYSTASYDDVSTLNLLQLATARENVYFSGGEQSNHILQLHMKAQRVRSSDSVRVVETGSDEDDRVSLLHLYDQMPQLHLKLSFLTTKRKARRVPLHERVQGKRKGVTISPPTGPEPPFKGPMRFNKFIGRR